MPLFGAANAAPNKTQQFYTSFLILMSPLSQSSISEVEFLHLDLTVFFINFKSLKTVREAFRSP